jgi:hypothetical protein
LYRAFRPANELSQVYCQSYPPLTDMNSNPGVVQSD